MIKRFIISIHKEQNSDLKSHHLWRLKRESRLFYMEKNYNYTRRKLYLPEYGRHIHEMVDQLMAIEDREERNRQARAVIDVMGNLQPTLRDTADFTHKLWDHLFIMSDFQLDVDSPYPRPTREDLMVTPRKMQYSQERIAFKHYGKYVARMFRKLGEEQDKTKIDNTVDALARYMRSKSFEYNQEHPNNEVIIKDIKQMSENGIEIDEVALNNLRSDYKQHLSARPQKGVQRPTIKPGVKSVQQKPQFAAGKSRPTTRVQKNNSDNPVRHNSQK